MISEKIRSLIEDKLNDNTYSKRFVVGSFVEKKDQRVMGYVYNIDNGYTLIETNYIPVILTAFIDFKPIPNQINGYATCNLVFLVSADFFEENKEGFLEDLDAINEVVHKVVGNYETFTDDERTYRSVWNMEAITPTGNILPLNGKQYIQVKTTIWIDFSDTNHYGNEYSYQLNGNNIVAIDGHISRENEEMNPHLLNDPEAKGDNQTSTWSASLSIMVDDYITELMDYVSEITYDMADIFQFKEITPNKTITNSVKIKSFSKPTMLGEKAIVSMILYKSDEEYTES